MTKYYIHYVAGVDYAMSTALVFNVTISAGSTSSSFSIDIINDMIQEDNETFNITIRLLPNCLSLSLRTSSSTVMIIDDDGIYIHILIYTIMVDTYYYHSLVIMIDFASSRFNGSESDEVVAVQIMTLGGIISTKNFDVNITFVSISADG